MWSKIFTFVAIASIAISAYFLIFPDKQTVTFTQAEIQETMNQQMPLIGVTENGSYSIENAEITISPETIEVTGTAIVEMKDIKRKRRVTFDSLQAKITFDSGYFYLSNIQLGNSITADHLVLNTEKYGTYAEGDVTLKDSQVQLEISKAPLVGTFWLYVMIAVGVIILIIIAARAGVLGEALVLFAFLD